jgi:anaerobic magnesium-protoporphyrin IX monomethyl ester cyclase
MEHRSDYRTSATDAVRLEFVPGLVSDDDGFDAVAHLKEIRAYPLDRERADNTPRVLHISLYCYKSFPARIFHAMCLKDGVDSFALFFKNNFTNHHLPVTEEELTLAGDLVRGINPDLITMSIMAPYAMAARQLVERLRKMTDAPIVAGGKYPTIVPHEALGFADFACKGEGDLTMLRINERLRRGQDLRGVKGLWYKDEDGRVVDMGQDTLYQDMDDIPYPAIDEAKMYFIEKGRLDTVDPEIYDDEVLVMAGRGCVYLCSFCVNSLLIPMNRGNGRFVRLRSPDHVMEELAYRMKKYREPRMVTFNDEVFGVFDERVEEFAVKYKEQCGLPFECELVPRLIKEENVKRLADAGMFSLHFGVQSGQDEIRKDVMHRPGSNDELREKSRMLRDNGIDPQYDIILDNPFDTADSLADALGLLLDFGSPIKLNTYKMQFFPHYPFTNMALEAGHIGPDQVSDEKIAESVLYNWAYRPKFPAFSRRDYLENCIYLIPWQSGLVRKLLRRLQRRHDPVLGFAASVLAKMRYWQAFQHVGALVWLRRVYLGLGLILRGEFGTFTRRAREVLKKVRYQQTNSGRMSVR